MIHFDEMACLLYLEGQLEPSRAREMTLHIGECMACRTLLHALERESHVLSAALLEDNEAMPARLLTARSWGVPSWVWTLAFGVCAFGAYWLWADSVDPWLQQLSNAGFGGTDFMSMLLFSGAFWEGWSDMIDGMQIGALILLAIVAIVWIRRRLRRYGKRLGPTFGTRMSCTMCCIRWWRCQMMAATWVPDSGSFILSGWSAKGARQVPRAVGGFIGSQRSVPELFQYRSPRHDSSRCWRMSKRQPLPVTTPC